MNVARMWSELSNPIATSMRLGCVHTCTKSCPLAIGPSETHARSEQGFSLKQFGSPCYFYKCFMLAAVRGLTGKRVIKTDVSAQPELVVRPRNHGIWYWQHRAPEQWAPGELCKAHLTSLMDSCWSNNPCKFLWKPLKPEFKWHSMWFSFIGVEFVAEVLTKTATVYYHQRRWKFSTVFGLN